MSKPVALTIAGSDPSGGAGIQADLKTFHQFGVYGEAVVTLITVQNTVEVKRVECCGADLVAQQIRAVVSDIPPQAAKTGALGNWEIIEVVAAAAAGFNFPLVVDPVILTKHHAALLTPDAIEALKILLFPHTFLLDASTCKKPPCWTRHRRVRRREHAARGRDTGGDGSRKPCW